jgi:hypothetical protein
MEFLSPYGTGSGEELRSKVRREQIERMSMTRQPNDKSSARAAKLREEIEKLRRGGDKGQQDNAPKPKDAMRPATPREFIRERMHELDKKKDG